MTATPPAPTVVGYTDASPCPRVEVTVTPMPSDAVTVTVTRAYNGRSDVVRGASNAPVAGDFFVVDYDAPFGTPATYTCQTFDVNGVPSQTSNPSVPVTLDVADVWASDPLDPSTSMPWPLNQDGPLRSALSMKFGSFTGYQLPATQSALEILGSPYPIGQSNVRQAAQSVPIILDARDSDQWTAIQQLLGQAMVVCVRLPVRVPLLDPVMYMQFPNVSPAVDPNLARVVWSLTGTQVRGPSLSVIVPVRTYADGQQEAATYADAASRYSSYLVALRGH